jgi:nucleoside-diphosphate-sugar epimerase
VEENSMTIQDQSRAPLYSKGTVLVTGGSGFIGTHLVSALADVGATIVNLDVRAPLPEHRAYWVKCDLNDQNAVARLVAQTKPVLIYNLAAHARLDGTAKDMQVNVEGVRNLIAATAGMSPMPLLVQASTMVVAGVLHEGFDPQKFEPQFGLYAESKVDAEKLIHALPHEFRWTIVRPSVIWGPYHSTFPSQVWRYIRLRYYMHPSGFDAVRSYGYVGNVAHQLMRIAEADPSLTDGRTFYVGDEPLPSTQWLDAFSRAITGRPVRRVPGWLLTAAAYAGELSGRIGGPSPINLGRLARMTSDFSVPMRLTYTTLGSPPISLEEGVARTVRWLKTL